MGFNPLQFGRDVSNEVKKVTWPTRKETLVTTALIVVMAILAAVFFMVVDWGLSNFIKAVLFGVKF
jgi:preprotein translocase subunit SecE